MAAWRKLKIWRRNLRRWQRCRHRYPSAAAALAAVGGVAAIVAKNIGSVAASWRIIGLLNAQQWRGGLMLAKISKMAKISAKMKNGSNHQCAVKWRRKREK